MSRLYRIRDERGERTLQDSDLPLTIGGATAARIVLPDFDADRQAAYLALSDGHVYLQPADRDTVVFHNHERLQASAWLKSGDLIEIDQAVLRWTVRGDQVVIEVARRSSPDDVVLVPPADSRPAPLPDNRLVREKIPGSQRKGRWRFLAAGLLGLLLLAALFLLLATPVRIAVEPEPEQIALRGFPVPIPLWGRYLSLPGDYVLHAEREGYYPLNERVVVDDAGQGEFRFVLEPLPGRLAIQVDPPIDFTLTVDGSVVEPDAGGLFPVPQGLRRLQLAAERYLPEERDVEVEGLGRQQDLAFTLRPAWAAVRVVSEPAGATVRVDDAIRGETPLETELLQGLRTLQLSLPGHKTVTLQQPVRAGEDLVLDGLILPPADGELTVQTMPAGATVSVGAEFHGRTPVTVTLAPEQTHEITLYKAGFARWTQTVTLEPEERRLLEARLSPELGTVFLTTQPADATLSIDGVPKGPATQRLRLATRPQLFEIRSPGHATRRITVTPKAAASQSVEVTLQRLGQAAVEAPPTARPGVLSGQHRTAGGYTLELVRPGGTFTMGASRREPGRRANESPRSVELTRPFYLGVREVTNAQFREFRPAHSAGVVDGAGLDSADQPVVDVSWDDAARYCNWLSRQEGLPPAYEERGGAMRLIRPVTRGYRLPTEAEWAYVARVYRRSEPARYPWTGTYPPRDVVGNFADARIADTLAEVVPAGYDDGYRGPAPVGSFPASPSGFFDLGGNVAEWTNDAYTPYPASAQTPVRDPLGPESGDHRVVRGSSWRHANITELRLSYRDYSKRPRKDLGFRVARYADD
ncbi:MAG: SUMF1/EgtB/PvdO family nonheme iron enzyme [Chromatiaceae bacterium]